ncbi:conserved hypothetical protein [uncultured Desulfobacterium sp.]|uniref:DUF4911 domain-containing protein n=1 Tax=uncultured Desulfobacterium sp. TaxID=201089 RepID=A0A445N1H7_9BACT|nr:conserved hypothetical protein [uncultured Desulfobacterium sp.]
MKQHACEIARTIRRLYRVDRKDIAYLRTTLESYDGMAVVSTIDQYDARVEVAIAPGCEEIIFGLLDSLRSNEGLSITEL